LDIKEKVVKQQNVIKTYYLHIKTIDYYIILRNIIIITKPKHHGYHSKTVQFHNQICLTYLLLYQLIIKCFSKFWCVFNDQICCGSKSLLSLSVASNDINSRYEGT
jgi:hypothetical protein